MAQADVDAAALLVALTRVCKLFGMASTQSMGTVSDTTGVTASTIPILDFANKVTLPGSQAQKAPTGGV